MNPSTLAFCYLAAGLSLGVGLINLIAGFQKEGDKVYRYFGLIGASTGIYFLLYPSLFEPGVSEGYQKFSLSFLVAYYALFPFFAEAYTLYTNDKLKWGITFWTLGVVYPMMLFSFPASFPGLWSNLGHISMLGISVFGLLAALYQIRTGQKRSGWFFLLAMLLFALLMLEEVLHVYLGLDLLFSQSSFTLNPIDLFPLFFVIGIGGKLANDQIRQYRLEQQLRVREQRWSKLLSHIKLLMVQWDNAGNVNYVNPYFTQITGYSPEEVLTTGWFQSLALREADPNELPDPKDAFSKEWSVETKAGDTHLVNWSVVRLKDSEEEVDQSLAIGIDVTERHQAFSEIQRLKNLVEHENESLAQALAEIEALKSMLEKENLELKRELHRYAEGTEGLIIGKSNSLMYAIQRAVQVAPTLASVLLEGETGVGKELFAILIHRKSERSHLPFVKVNCATLPRDLIESELFGHEKGAFTGAANIRKGRFELADGGTLFLDEIGELPVELQPKLLRVLQSGEFERLGGQKTLKVNVRVISATNRNLEQQIKEGAFREDLYYRLNVYPITIPPLRDRREDISLLVDFFVERICKKNHKSFSSISKSDLATLIEYDWPGNVRELENVIERAVIISSGDTLRLEVSTQGQGGANGQGTVTLPQLSLEEVERNHILKVLDQCDWKINGSSGAAERLQVNPNTLRSKMKKLRIERPG